MFRKPLVLNNGLCLRRVAKCVHEGSVHETSMGRATYVAITRPDGRAMSWREVYDCFSEVYPDKWAVQFFPPKDELVDRVNMYHLYVLDTPPEGVNIKPVNSKRYD
jgi:hypothetical protein